MNEPQDALSRRDIDRLATYNAEVYRGIVHTEEYANEMARLQRSFNDTQIAWRSESEYVAPGNSEGCAAPAQVSDRKIKLENLEEA